MNELNEEIKLTINTMQCDIDDGAHSELQSHLCSLLEIKRNELQQRLVERTWAEPVMYGQSPYKSAKLDMQIVGEAMLPLTSEELKAGGWWCGDTSEECQRALSIHNLEFQAPRWDGKYHFCFMRSGPVYRGLASELVRVSSELKQIKRIGIEFYWGE